MQYHFLFLFIVAHFTSNVACRKSTPNDFGNMLNLSKAKCTGKLLKSYESKLVRMLAFGPNGRTFPSSIEEMKQFCNETSRLSAQVESFSKECLKPEIHNLVSVFLYSVRSTFNRNYCGAKNLKKSLPYIKSSVCINRYYFSDYSCFVAFNNQTARLVNLKDDKVKIPYTCCNFNKLLDCLGRLMDAHTCSAKYREEFLDVIRRSTAGLTDIVCSEYTEASDRCQQLGPAPSAPNSKQYNSFILALIDLIASMGSFSSANL